MPPVKAPTALAFVKYRLLEPSGTRLVFPENACAVTFATIIPLDSITIPEPLVNACLALVLVKNTYPVVGLPVSTTWEARIEPVTFAVILPVIVIRPLAAITIPLPPVNAARALAFVK